MTNATSYAPRLITARQNYSRTGHALPPAPCWSCGEPCVIGAPIYWHKQGYRGVDGKTRSPVWHEHCAQPATYQPPSKSQGDEQAEEPEQAPAPVTNGAAQQQTFAGDTQRTFHVEPAPSAPTKVVPVQPIQAPKPTPAQTAPDAVLASLAAAVAPYLQDKLRAAESPAASHVTDEARVKQLASEVFNAGVPKLNELLAREVAKGLTEARDQAKAGAYEGTSKAITEAQAKGTDTSKLEVPPPVPTLDPLYESDTDTGALIRLCLATGRNMLVSGPSGSGKTFPIRMECAKSGRPVVELSAGDGIGYSHLIGGMTLERDAQGGIVTGWRNGAVLRAMIHGAVLILDELDQLPRPLLALLYGVLEPGRVPSIYVPELGKEVVAKDGFLVAGTGNTVRDTSGLYSGERPSAALLNRCAAIPADYLPPSSEQKILERTGLLKQPARAIVEALAGLRQLYNQESITVAPSTRTGVQVARAIQGLGPDGNPPKANAPLVTLKPMQAWTLYLLGALPDAQVAKAKLTLSSAYNSVGQQL